MVRLHNTLTRRKEEVAPGDAPLSLFVCGESLHDAPTLESARQAVFFDALARHLRRGGRRVTVATSLLDTDGRIAARARLERRSPAEVAAANVPVHEAALRALAVAPPDRLLLSSASRDAAREIAGILRARGYAYPTSAGLAFRARAFPEYGALSGQRGDKLLSAREDAAAGLEDPLDFLIWTGGDGEGGAPTWHLECPALTFALLGPRIDLHGGCADLVHPHDENTRAIMESAFGGPFARLWLHVGPVAFAARDVAADRTRLFRLPDLFERADPLDVRFYLLSHLYRKPMSFEPERIADAAVSRAKLARFLEELGGGDEPPPADVVDLCRGANEALDDDFNAPRAIGLLHLLRKRVRAHPAYPAPPFGRRVAGCARAILGILLGEGHDETNGTR